jgi:hypothetical protein
MYFQIVIACTLITLLISVFVFHVWCLMLFPFMYVIISISHVCWFYWNYGTLL